MPAWCSTKLKISGNKTSMKNFFDIKTRLKGTKKAPEKVLLNENMNEYNRNKK